MNEEEIERYRRAEEKALNGFILALFGGYIVCIGGCAAMLRLFGADMDGSLKIGCIVGIILWSIIFFAILFNRFLVWTQAYKVTILMDPFVREEMRDMADILEEEDSTKGMRPVKRGLRAKRFTETFVAVIDIKKIGIEDEKEKMTWITEDEQQVYVDDEFFIVVIPELAVRHYRYRTIGIGMERIINYFRGKTETFKQTFINGKTMKWLRDNPHEFDAAFKAFVKNDADLEKSMLRLGVRIVDPSIFEVVLIQIIKDTLIEAQQTERDQLAVDIIENRGGGVTRLQANQLWLAGKGLANLEFQIRDENINVHGLPDGLVNYTHNSGTTGQSGKNPGGQGGQPGKKGGGPKPPGGQPPPKPPK